MINIINNIKTFVAEKFLPRYLYLIKKYNLFFVLLYFIFIFLGIVVILQLKINYHNTYQTSVFIDKSNKKPVSYYEIKIEKKNPSLNLISIITEIKNNIKDNKFLKKHTKQFFDKFPTWIEYKYFLQNAKKEQIDFIIKLIKVRNSTNSFLYPFLIKAIDNKIYQLINNKNSFFLKGNEFFPFKKNVKNSDYLLKKNQILLLIEPNFSLEKNNLSKKYYHNLKLIIDTYKEQIGKENITISIHGLSTKIYIKNKKIFSSIIQSIVFFLLMMILLILLFFKIKNALLIILLPLILSLTYSFIILGVIHKEINIYYLIIISLMGGINGSYGFKLFAHFRQNRLNEMGITEALIDVFKNLGYKISPFFFFVFIFFLFINFSNTKELNQIGQIGILNIILTIFSYILFFPVFVFLSEKWKKSASTITDIIKGKYRFIALWIIIIIAFNLLGILAIFNKKLNHKPISKPITTERKTFIESRQPILIKNKTLNNLKRNHIFLMSNNIQIFSYYSFIPMIANKHIKRIEQLKHLIFQIKSKEKIYLDINNAIENIQTNHLINQEKNLLQSIFRDSEKRYNLLISSKNKNITKLKILCKKRTQKLCKKLNKKLLQNQQTKFNAYSFALDYIQTSIILTFFFVLLYLFAFRKIAYFIFLIWPFLSSLLSIYGIIYLICDFFNLNNYYFIYSMLLNLPVFISLSFGLGFILTQQVKINLYTDIRQIMHKIGNNIFFLFMIVFIGYISLIFISETIIKTIGFTGAIGSFIIYFHYSILYPLSVRIIWGSASNQN